MNASTHHPLVGVTWVQPGAAGDGAARTSERGLGSGLIPLNLAMTDARLRLAARQFHHRIVQEAMGRVLRVHPARLEGVWPRLAMVSAGFAFRDEELRPREDRPAKASICRPHSRTGRLTLFAQP
jgi:hypothetical protein